MMAIAAFAAATACSADYPTAPDRTVNALKIHVAATIGDLVPNSTAQFVAYEIDSNGIYTDVTKDASWSTSNSEVLSTLVAGNSRLVRTISPGDANLIVSHGGRTDSVPLRVYPSLRSDTHIEIDSVLSLPAINPGRTTSLTVQVRSFSPVGVSQVVTTASAISTSDPNIAIADGATIRPVSPGTFRVIATYNGLTATALSSVLPTTQAPLP